MIRLQDLLARAPAPAARGVLRFELLGIDESVDVCDLCGKKDLKCTMVLREFDAEGNELGEVHYGRDCGAAALGWNVSADRAEKIIRGEARFTYDELERLWRPLAQASGGAETVFDVVIDGVPLTIRNLYAARKAPKGWTYAGGMAWKLRGVR